MKVYVPGLEKYSPEGNFYFWLKRPWNWTFQIKWNNNLDAFKWHTFWKRWNFLQFFVCWQILLKNVKIPTFVSIKIIFCQSCITYLYKKISGIVSTQYATILQKLLNFKYLFFEIKLSISVKKKNIYIYIYIFFF